MKFTITALGALALTSTLATTSAMAGGLDRGLVPYSVMFEKGRVVQLGFSSVTPSVSGKLQTGATTFLNTGNMAQSYVSPSLSFKTDLNDKLAVAVFMNTPYGADASYTQGAYVGLQAHWDSKQIGALLKYKVNDNASVYAGLRYVTSSATINIPVQMTSGAGTYTATAASDSKIGYVVGAAYEIPDIALRVGLSYESKITHSFATAERFANITPTPVNSVTEIELPQSVALDFQSGVAKDTLVFGSVRWSEWSNWEVRPAHYQAVASDRVTGFDNNVISYQLGIGRRLNENLSVFARAGYEKANGGVASRLAPTDGSRSIGIGGSYTKDNMKITGGVEYVKLGDGVDASNTKFASNSAVGVGISVSFGF